MFAGIVEAKGRIKAVETKNKMRHVRIEAPRSWKLPLGASVNVDGICSTIVKKGNGFFDVEYMPATLSKTTAGSFVKGRTVNLERSLKYGQRIDGHPVQGHVDCTAVIRGIAKKGSSRELTFKPNALLARSVALHGSVAINGVSLTIAKKHGPNITVALIPYTLKHTDLGTLKTGDTINIEFDHSQEYLAAVRKK
jgi:riboflavin synthase